jgi:hypothetical protein
MRFVCAPCNSKLAWIDKPHHERNFANGYGPRRIENGLAACSLCHEMKPFTDFYLDAKQKFGIVPQCKTCMSAKSKTKYRQRKAAQAA